MEYIKEYEQYLDTIQNPNSSQSEYEKAKRKVAANFQYFLERGSNPTSLIAYRGRSFGLSETNDFLKLIFSIDKTSQISYGAISFWTTIAKTAVHYASSSGSYNVGQSYKLILATRVPAKFAISTQRYYANMLDLDEFMHRDVNLILPNKKLKVEIASVSAKLDDVDIVYNNKKYPDASLNGKIKVNSIEEFIESV